jgi:hypothetical protein
MRNLASTLLAAVALAVCAPGLSLGLPLAGGIDRAIAAAPAGGQTVLIQDEPRRSRADAARRSRAAGRAYDNYPFYPGRPTHQGVIVGNGYPYYYSPNGYPYYYAGRYWPHYYGRYLWPGYDYSPFAFFGYAPSDFQ